MNNELHSLSNFTIIYPYKCCNNSNFNHKSCKVKLETLELTRVPKTEGS